MSTTRIFFFLFSIWIFVGCEHESLTGLASDEDYNLSIKADLLTGKLWLWLESYDPYQGGTWYRPDSLNAQHTFVFAKDGSFVEDRPRGCCRQVGTWELKNNEQILFLHYTDNGNQNLTYELRELTAGVLKLAWQGRHGMVVDAYVAQPK